MKKAGIEMSSVSPSQKGKRTNGSKFKQVIKILFLMWLFQHKYIFLIER